MKASQLKAIHARARNASPGPWVQWAGHGEIVSSPPSAPVTENTRGSMRGGAGEICRLEEDDNDNWENDAKFILKSRTDIPALLSETAKLTKERDEARGAAIHLRRLREHPMSCVCAWCEMIASWGVDPKKAPTT